LTRPHYTESYKTPSRHVPKRPLSMFTIVFRIKYEEAIFLKCMLSVLSRPSSVLSCSSRHAYSVQDFPGLEPLCLPAVSRRACLRCRSFLQLIGRFPCKPLLEPGDCLRNLSYLPLSQAGNCFSPEILRYSRRFCKSPLVGTRYAFRICAIPRPRAL